VGNDAGIIRRVAAGPTEAYASLAHTQPLNISRSQGRELFCTHTDDSVACFWSKVNRGTDDDCWEWTGTRSPRWRGYGRVSSGPHRGMLAHRLAYALAVGPIPEGLLVCHHCDNRPCCNPAHLFLGTEADNTQDCIKKGRFIYPPPVGAAHPHYSVLYPERVLRGEKITTSKLKPDQVREIKDASSRGALSKDLAAQYGVAKSTISSIINNRWWRHIPCPTL
jgi:hypothetical protein